MWMNEYDYYEYEYDYYEYDSYEYDVLLGQIDDSPKLIIPIIHCPSFYDVLVLATVVTEPPPPPAALV